MIYDILPVNNYSGNNSSTIFDFDFYIENENQLHVYLINEDESKAQLEYGVDYSINEFKNKNGSYITFPLSSSAYSVLMDTQKLSIALYLPIQQETQFNNSSLVNLDALEYSFDYLTRLIQILSRKIELCVQVQEGGNVTATELVNDLYERANQVLVNRNEIVSSSTQINQNIETVRNLIIELNSVIDSAKSDILNQKNTTLDLIRSSGCYVKNNKIFYLDSSNNEKQLLIAPASPLLSSIWSDHILNDISWLRADTFSWQDGTVYSIAYNKLVEEYATGTEETFGSGSEYEVKFKRTSNGFKITTSDYESAVLGRYNANYDCWFYILDTTNKRFKLPRTKWGFKGVRDTVGNFIPESLPNITGSINTIVNNIQFVGTGDAIGALSTRGTVENVGYPTSSNYQTQEEGITIDASRSSSAYQNGAAVQERATQMYLYFYVGEYSQTAVEQSAGITSEQLNNKLDISGGTITGTLNIQTAVLLKENSDVEGGQIYFAPADKEKTTMPMWIDRCDGTIRIIGHDANGNAHFLLAADAQTGRVALNDGNATVIAMYQNGYSGYIIWSNGYCEQWGVTGSTTNTYVGFLKTYASNTYNIQLTSVAYSSGANDYAIASNWTSNGMNIVGSTAMPIMWRVCGWLAAGQY